MTPNNPKSVQPDSFSPEEPMENITRKERPNPEQVSPSQRGRFLSALGDKGKKGEKKIASEISSTEETVEQEEFLKEIFSASHQYED